MVSSQAVVFVMNFRKAFLLFQSTCSAVLTRQR